MAKSPDPFGSSHLAHSLRVNPRRDLIFYRETVRNTSMLSRRELLLGAVVAGAAKSVPLRPPGELIEAHEHLFAGDPARFPYSKLSYAPKPNPVEAYVQF